MSVFLALLYGLDRYGLNPSVLRMADDWRHLAAYSAVAASAFACAFVPPRWRKEVLLAAGAGAASLVLGLWSVLLFGHVALVVGVVRMRTRIVVQVVLVFLAWATVPVARMYWLGADAQVATILLAIIWTAQLYSALYLIVERAREAVEDRSTVIDDAFYLLAPPRFLVPFFQPISPRLLASSIRPGMPWPLFKRGAALAAYGAAVSVAAWRLGALAREQAYPALGLAITFLHVYARITYTIFLAVALFRLLGFNLRSGFEYPFLSRSFAEFFRRFNYYVRDAVLSLFYFPLLGHLRTRLSPRIASIVSAYIAILVGSFLLHDVLVPLSITIAPEDSLHHYLDPVRVAGFVLLWTLIIVPTAGIAPKRPPPITRTKLVLSILAFNVVYFALWCAQHVGRGPW